MTLHVFIPSHLVSLSFVKCRTGHLAAAHQGQCRSAEARHFTIRKVVIMQLIMRQSFFMSRFRIEIYVLYIANLQVNGHKYDIRPTLATTDLLRSNPPDHASMIPVAAALGETQIL
jgi:hypothetical protein